MGLLKKLQIRLLKRDIKKNKSNEYLARNYSMSMLVEAGAFVRYKNSELYCPVDSYEIYNSNSELLGSPKFLENGENSEYLILVREDPKTFLTSVAVYNLNGEVIVPHDCYKNVYMAKDYAILTMPMEDFHEGVRVRRSLKPEDETTALPATNKTLKETLGGSLLEPRTLIVSKDKITSTKYLSVEPLDIPQYNKRPLENNTVWIGQTENKEEITFKFDKRLYLTETYRLPYFSHEDDVFFADEETNAVYYLNTEDKTRINLRTGEKVSLLNLKRTKLSKAERFAYSKEETKLEEVVDSENVDDVVVVETEIPPFTDDEIGEYNPSSDE